MTLTHRAVLRVQGWRVDPWLDEMSRDGQTVKLEPRTMRTLIYLAAHAGEVVSIDALLDEVWRGVVVTHDSVYQAIATLRRALGENGEGSSCIINVPKRGYRLVAEVGPWDEPSVNEVPAGAVPLPGGFKRMRWVAGGSLAVLVVAACGLAWWQHGKLGATRSKIALPVSLAVLPFDDLSEKADRGYLAEGMSQELIDALSRLPAFRVIGRASSFRFPNYHRDDFAALGQQLGAAYFLTGSIRTEAQRLRVVVKLNAAVDGTQLWSQSLEGPIGDALRMEDDIAKNVSSTLAGSSPTPVASNQRSVDPRAFAAYLKGIHEFYQFDRPNLEEAAQDFQTALDLDPRYDRAAIVLAGARVAQASFEFVPVREGFERARTAANAALALNPAAADGHSVLAKVHMWYDWDWDAADGEIKKGLALQPNSTLLSWDAAELASTLGRWDESVRMMEQRVRSDPMDGDGFITFGAILYAAGRFHDAEAATRKGLSLVPGYVSGYFYLGKILIAEGRIQEAHEEMLKDFPEGGKLQGLAMSYYLLGRSSESDSAMERAVKDSGGKLPFETALAYSVRGQRDLAFEWLERAYREKSPALYKIKGEPLFGNLKSDPRYAALLQRMNLPR